MVDAYLGQYHRDGAHAQNRINLANELHPNFNSTLRHGASELYDAWLTLIVDLT